MELYSSEADYLSALKGRAGLPRGFRAGSVSVTFQPEEIPAADERTMDLSLILLEEPTELFGGVFTRNTFPGVPVELGRERLEHRTTRGVLINNKIANVCTPGGREKAQRILTCLGGEAGVPGDEFFFASTGVIGWALPEEAICKGLPNLMAEVEKAGTSLYSVSRGIMTTDAFPKVRSAETGEGCIVATAKGAGMIEPNMATMLAFILTDVVIPRDALRSTLADIVQDTFNAISIDGDQSTSDMVLIFSSGVVECSDRSRFENSLHEVCRKLSEDLVRNGEGTGHVIRVRVDGAENREHALGIGKAVINSPLVKTAVYGNDPNVGRIVMALGDYTGNSGIPVKPELVRIALGGEVIFDRGAFILDNTKETKLSRYLSSCALETQKTFPEHEQTVDITLDLGMGNEGAEVLGSDLSYEYVRENADYRT